MEDQNELKSIFLADQHKKFFYYIYSQTPITVQVRLSNARFGL
jgi:hypothetical protein